MVIENLPERLKTLKTNLNRTPITQYILNPRDEVGVTNLELYRQNLNRVNRFRKFYYTNKVRKPLRDLLWLTIRLPRIELANHPDRLREVMEGVGAEVDLEEIVKNFGI
jgi:hypothetical protein